MTIRRSVLTTIMAGATLGALATTALAADIIHEPRVIEAPVIDKVKPFGGWYIRGDLGYSFNRARDKSSYTGDLQDGSSVFGGQPPILLEPASPDAIDNEIDDTYFAGVGIGAHMGQYLRGDITADFHFGGHNSAPFVGDGGNNPSCVDGLCDYEFGGDFDAITVMANAYVDFGTFAGITPYVGAGIGFAHVNYDDVTGTFCGDPSLSGSTGEACDPTGNITAERASYDYEGSSSLRLAWSLAAGASYDVSDSLAIDGGYRFTRIDDGEMLHVSGNKLDDGGIDMHQVRIGARYKLH